MRARACLFSGLLGTIAAFGCGNGGEIQSTTSGHTGGVINGGGGESTGLGTVSVTTSSTTTGHTGGAPPVCPSTPPIEGPPLSTPTGQWTWVDVDGAKCRDGSPAGFGVRRSATSKNLYIYLEGGGACFNGTTCAISLAAFGKVAFDAWAGTVGQTGIFNGSNSENPVEDWNAVYVPYCSADVHAGNAAHVDVFGGPKDNTFLGYQNIGLFLQRIVATWKDAPQVLLTGISAGGFGAAFNYDRVAAAFCPTKVVLVDDSGPPMSDTYLAPCLQQLWRGLWNLSATIPADCVDCAQPSGGGIVNYVPYLAARWPQSNLGLISSTRDAVISTFYGYGTNDCTAGTPIPGALYAAGLDELRATYMASSGKWGTYYVDSTQHTYLLGPGFFTTEVNGVKLTRWMRDLLHGAASHVGP